MMEVLWRLVLAVALLCLTSEAKIGCKDKDNKDVDWYILYKLPKSFEAFYMDPAKEEMIPDISHQAGALANTLQPYFSKKPGNAFIAYNDQLPTCNALEKFGHSKGFIMIDGTSGFWLLHSTPRLPSGRESNNFFPSSGKRNAQTFICVTVKNEKIDNSVNMYEVIGKHLQYINAYPYEHDIPTTLPKALQDAANGVADNPNKLTVFHQQWKSGSQTFRSFVKKKLSQSAAAGSKRQKPDNDDDDDDDEEDDPCTKNEEDCKRAKDGDLYSIIAESINSDVKVQHWGNQRGRCGNYEEVGQKKVLNVKCVKIDNKEPWLPSSDHSKWSVSEDGDWTCFGDSNRAPSQFKRRGGALCIQDQRVKDKFKSFIKAESDCPNPTKKAKKN